MPPLTLLLYSGALEGDFSIELAFYLKSHNEESMSEILENNT